MALRIECDFRHALAQPMIMRDDGGPVISVVHGVDRVTIALSDASLHALGLAILTSIGESGC